MIKELIYIRLIQSFRATKGIGLLRLFSLLITICFILFGLFKATSDSANSYYTTCIYMLIIAFIQYKRPDKQFLEMHFVNYRKILLNEYILLASPLIISLLIHFQWIAIGLVIVTTISITHLNIKTQQINLNSFIQRLIPAECFEWKSGLRRYLFVFTLIWIVGLLASFYIATVPITIALLALIIFTFYERSEPLSMIIIAEKSHKKFIINKLKTHFALFTITIIPLIVAFLIFHSHYWYISLAEFILLSSILIYHIVLKYAFYRPNEQSGTQIYNAIGFLGFIMPIFFLPIVWILTVRFYLKSQSNLKFYLNDYN